MNNLPVFLEDVVVSEEDELRLAPHLSNWLELNEFFKSDPSLDDLDKLLLMEICGKRRTHILKKIKARFNRRIAVKEWSEIEQYLQKQKKE